MNGTALFFLVLAAAAPTGGDFLMEASVVKNGGGLVSGDEYALQSSVGQAAPVVMARGGIELQGGLLAAGFTDILFFDYFEVEG